VFAICAEEQDTTKDGETVLGATKILLAYKTIPGPDIPSQISTVNNTTIARTATIVSTKKERRVKGSIGI
jgi:hypothetical protein